MPAQHCHLCHFLCWRPLDLGCSSHSETILSRPYLHRKPRMMLSCVHLPPTNNRHPPDFLLEPSEQGSEVSQMSLEKGSPDLRWEVLLRSLDLQAPAHPAGHNLSMLRAAGQDTQEDCHPISPSIGRFYLVPSYSTIWLLLCPPECTAVAKLVDTVGHVGCIMPTMPTDGAGPV